MVVIGITGPSGAGKGAVSRILNEKYGFPVLDADEIYHSIVNCPSPCLQEISEEFGRGVINPNGSLNRTALSELVFGDENKDKLKILNQITHKHVIDEMNKCMAVYQATESACVIDAPLLLEAGISKNCDFTIAVIAQKDIRVSRISARDNISEEAALKRINSQKDTAFYIENTDYVIQNDGDLSLLVNAVYEIMRERGLA